MGRAMTVVVAINALDSIVLASDSATTQSSRTRDGQLETNNIWNSASKIFNLRYGWPIAAVTWGLASVGGRSVATLAKELRCRFSGQRQDHADWALDVDSYTIQQVAERVKEFFYDEHGQHDSTSEDGLGLGLAVAGYSAGSGAAELFLPQCCGPVQRELDQPAVWWVGQPEAITRLVKGASPRLSRALVELGLDPGDPAVDTGELAEQIADQIMASTSVPLVFPGMPVGEAIELAEFLVDLTIKYVRFTPGHQVVGGPIEVAAMTQHEGFKWIKRKHYYSQALNLEGAWP